MSQFATYLVGFFLFVIGLGFVAWLIQVPTLWIVAGAIILVGIGVMMASTRTPPADRQRRARAGSYDGDEYDQGRYAAGGRAGADADRDAGAATRARRADPAIRAEPVVGRLRVERGGDAAPARDPYDDAPYRADLPSAERRRRDGSAGEEHR